MTHRVERTMLRETENPYEQKGRRRGTDWSYPPPPLLKVSRLFASPKYGSYGKLEGGWVKLGQPCHD